MYINLRHKIKYDNAEVGKSRYTVVCETQFILYEFYYLSYCYYFVALLIIYLLGKDG